MELPSETPKAKRSTINGELQTSSIGGTAGYYNVPSYYAKRGFSIDEAAASLGLRALSRRERGVRDDVLAEIHDGSGSGSFPCVRAEAAKPR